MHQPRNRPRNPAQDAHPLPFVVAREFAQKLEAAGVSYASQAIECEITVTKVLVFYELVLYFHGPKLYLAATEAINSELKSCKLAG